MNKKDLEDTFEINSEIRITRNYNRFKGLMAKLLIDNGINVNGNQLISQFKGNLYTLINMFRNPEISLFSIKGKLIQDYTYLKKILNDIIGFEPK